MIIDPYVDGVQIFTDSNITAIKGKDPAAVCEDIYRRVVLPRQDICGNILYDQLYELYIDVGGVGITYKHILTDMGLKVSDLRYRKPDAVLPIRNDYVGTRRNTDRLMDVRPLFY